MKSTEKMLNHIKAGCCYFYCQSSQPNNTVSDISEVVLNYCKEESSIRVWDLEGVKIPIYKTFEGGIRELAYAIDVESGGQIGDPMAVLSPLLEDKTERGVDKVPPWRFVIAKNFHWFLRNDYNSIEKQLVQIFQNRSEIYSSPGNRKVFIIVGDKPYSEAIPIELQKEFKSIIFDLPTEEEIEKLYTFIVESASKNPKFKVPDDKQKEKIISSAKGLTKKEVVETFSYSIITDKGDFNHLTVSEIRGEEINQTPGLTIGKHNKSYKSLIGLDILKQHIKDTIDDPEAKGVLIVGVAGTGKTHLSQSIAGEFDRLCIEWEFAQMMGSGLVGQAENAQAKAIEIVKANANSKAPIVLLMDEIEKGLSGMGSGNQAGAYGGGTTVRSNSQTLKFMSDEEASRGIYRIATCNNIRQLPPEWVRLGRWDAIFFTDLPNEEERKAILKFYIEEYNQKLKDEGSNFVIKNSSPDMEDWTGAEIKELIKMAKMKKRQLKEVAMFITPISKVMADEVKYLREWRVGRTVPASTSLASKEEVKALRNLEI